MIHSLKVFRRPLLSFSQIDRLLPLIRLLSLNIFMNQVTLMSLGILKILSILFAPATSLANIPMGTEDTKSSKKDPLRQFLAIDFRSTIRLHKTRLHIILVRVDSEKADYYICQEIVVHEVFDKIDGWVIYEHHSVRHEGDGIDDYQQADDRPNREPLAGQFDNVPRYYYLYWLLFASLELRSNKLPILKKEIVLNRSSPIQSHIFTNFVHHHAEQSNIQTPLHLCVRRNLRLVAPLRLYHMSASS